MYYKSLCALRQSDNYAENKSLHIYKKPPESVAFRGERSVSKQQHRDEQEHDHPGACADLLEIAAEDAYDYI